MVKNVHCIRLEDAHNTFHNLKNAEKRPHYNSALKRSFDILIKMIKNVQAGQKIWPGTFYQEKKQ